MRLNRYRQLPVPPLAEILRIYEAHLDAQPDMQPVPLALKFDVSLTKSDCAFLRTLKVKP